MPIPRPRNLARTPFLRRAEARRMVFARAAVFAATAKALALALAGHHLMFGGTLPWSVHLLTLAGLFGAGLVAAGFRGSLPVGLAVMSTAQVAAGGWLVQAGEDAAAACHHDGPWAAFYVVFTIALARLLHSADTAHAGMVRSASHGLAALPYSLALLLRPVLARAGVPGRASGDLADGDPVPPYEVLLAGAVVRRGPPALRQPATA
ncbi:hypothetical protein [Streptomyces sp. NPDC085540]|uniref:hypothetical protein n=1 Tax=Streptomyces sp. NPDC085540 TaxID=3365730 RepID=UPI0037D925A3